MSAMADDTRQGFERHVYAGFGVGASYLEPDASEIALKLEERSDAAFGLLLGVDLTQRFSLELLANDLGDAGLSDDQQVGYRLGSVSALFYGLNRKARREERRGLSAFARLGVSRMNNTTDVFYIREHDTSLMFGGGLEYGFRNGLATRAELISFDTDAHYAGLSLLYRFGYRHDEDEATAARSVASVTDEVAATPSVAANTETSEALDAPGDAATNPVDSVVLGYRIPFDTDSSVLGPLARARTVMVAAQLRQNAEQQVLLSGFADNRGTPAYNARLAERRVAAVTRLLLMRGVEANQIRSSVIGATTRFSTMTDARGLQENRVVEAIISLQPRQVLITPK